MLMPTASLPLSPGRGASRWAPPCRGQVGQWLREDRLDSSFFEGFTRTEPCYPGPVSPFREASGGSPRRRGASRVGARGGRRGRGAEGAMLRWGIWVVVVIAMSVGSLGGPTVAQAFLGASAADLVYTPVAPCRIIDTRAAGGPIGAGTQRDFLVSGTANFPAQGGTAGGCAVPEGATGAMLNLVAVNPSGAGDLRAWAFGQPAPGASTINYAAVAGLNIANGVAVPLCDPATSGCTFDVSVQADVSGTQLVVDVLGYLQSTAPRGASGAANIFLGVNAGNFTMTGTANTATGAFALTDNTTGGLNTATGVQALVSNTTGSSNTATGVNALFINT